MDNNEIIFGERAVFINIFLFINSFSAERK